MITLQVLRDRREFVDDGSDVGAVLERVGALPESAIREYKESRQRAVNPRWRTLLHHMFRWSTWSIGTLFVLWFLGGLFAHKQEYINLNTPEGPGDIFLLIFVILLIGGLVSWGAMILTNPIEWGTWDLEIYETWRIPAEVRKRILGPAWEIQPGAPFGVQRLNIGYFYESDHAPAIIVLQDESKKYREIDFFCDDKELSAA